MIKRFIFKSLTRRLVNFFLIVIMAVYSLNALVPKTAGALTPAQKNVFDSGIRYFDVEIACDNVGGGLVTDPSKTESTTPSSNKNVYVVGDSITAGMESKLKPALTTAGYVPTINGQGSRPLYYASGGRSGDIIDGFTAVNNDQAAVKSAGSVVIALGTNRQGGGEPEYRQKVGEMIDKVKGLAPSARIYWTNLVGTGSKNVYTGYNTILTELSASKGFTIIDWASKGAPLLPPNDVHPTGAGNEALTALIVSAIGGKPELQTALPGEASSCCAVTNSNSAGVNTPGVATRSIAAFVDAYGQFAYDNSITTGVPYDFTLGQAIIESGYGQSGLTKRANNFFGIKAGTGWTGETITMPTREVVNGSSITVNAAFRKYPTPLESFLDHDKFLRVNKRYAAAFNYSNDPFQFLAEIKKAGYATDPNYVSIVGKIIKGVQAYVASTNKWPPSSQVKYTVGPPTAGANSGGEPAATPNTGCTNPAANVDVIKKISFDTGRTIKPTAIILHWWGGVGSIDGLISTLNSRGLSVQLGATRDGKVYQLTPELHSYAAHAKCANGWGIGIEIEGGARFGPDPLGSGKQVALDLATNSAQFNSVVSVTRQLMQKYNIPIDEVLSPTGNSGTGVTSHKNVDVNCSGSNGKSDVDDVYLKRVKEELRKTPPAPADGAPGAAGGEGGPTTCNSNSQLPNTGPGSVCDGLNGKYTPAQIKTLENLRRTSKEPPLDQIVPIGNTRIHKSIAGKVQQMINDGKAAGINLEPVVAFRSFDGQVYERRLYCGNSFDAIYTGPNSNCTPSAAKPGQSTHQKGLAVDFGFNGVTDQCSFKDTPEYRWLRTNASRYGFSQLRSRDCGGIGEVWHWSVDGS